MAKCSQDISTKEFSCLRSNSFSTQQMLQMALWRQLWPWFWTAPKSQPWDFNLRSLSSLVKFRDVRRWWNQNLSTLSKLRTFTLCEKKRCQILPQVTCHPDLSVQAILLMESSYFHAWHKCEFKGFKLNAPRSRCAKNESMSNSCGWTPGTVAMTTHGFPHKTCQA